MSHIEKVSFEQKLKGVIDLATRILRKSSQAEGLDFAKVLN